jgi:O-antigen/teichoic acid export membrane protein
MAGSERKSLAVQTSHYSVASLFALISGLVTFPLLTRVFSVEDYGVMNLVAGTVTVLVTLGKVGVQHSIVRYHSEISAGKSRYTLAQLYSTTFVGMGSSALAVAVGLVVFARAAPAQWLDDPRLRVLFAMVSLLVVIQVLESTFLNVVRAEQATAAMMRYTVGKKYLSLGLIVIAVLWVARSLMGFYGAQIVAEAVAVATLAYVLFAKGDRPRPTLGQFSRPLYLELLGFGVPMMIGYELSSIILAVGDRYVIAGILGEAPLGLYGAAYNLCQYVQAVVITSVGQAIMPMYIDMWDRKGEAETSAFISRSLRTYVLFGAPVVAGLAAVGPELLPALASDKYASASAVLPWVIGGMVADGMNSMLGAGLFIHRRTRTIMKVVLSGAVSNILLNLLLVPRIGIMGSAIATLVCYIGTALGLGICGRRLLRVDVPWGTIARAGAASVVMYALLFWVHPGHRLVTVGIRAALGVPLYAGLIILVDADARGLAKKALLRFSPYRRP